jgi:anti-sigma factor RsiW
LELFFEFFVYIFWRKRVKLMDCSKVKSLLSEYFDGELKEDLSQKVKAHVEKCSYCRKELESIWKIESLMNKIPEPVLPEDFKDRVLERIPPIESDKRFFLRDILDWISLNLLSYPRIVGTVAIAILLIVIVVKEYGYYRGLSPHLQLEEDLKSKTLQIETQASLKKPIQAEEALEAQHTASHKKGYLPQDLAKKVNSSLLQEDLEQDMKAQFQQETKIQQEETLIASGENLLNDLVAPSICILTPEAYQPLERGSEICILFSSEGGLGVDPGNVNILIDGEDVTEKSLIEEGFAIYSPDEPFQEGVHELLVLVEDETGKVTSAGSIFVVVPRAET